MMLIFNVKCLDKNYITLNLLKRAMRDWELVDSDRFSFEDSDR